MARTVLQPLAEQSLRLVSDLASPLVAGLRRLAARFGSVASLRLPRPGGARPVARTVAVGTLGLVLGGAAAAMALVYFQPGPGSEAVPAAGAPLVSGPVKIVDATPRGDSCEDQVWPYIEQRCLRRAPAPAHTAAAPAEPEARRPAPPLPAPTAALAAAEPAAAAPAAEAPAPDAPPPLAGNDGAATLVAGAAAGAAAVQMIRSERRAERRRSLRRSARRPVFRVPILGLRF